MVKKMSLAEKRHHEKRIKDKFHRKNKHTKMWGDGDISAGIYANHGCGCSCWMCGNPRKYFGKKTIQELRAE